MESGAQSARTRTNHRNLFSPRMNPDVPGNIDRPVVRREPFESANIDGFVEPFAIALGFARVITNPAAHAGQGIFLQDDAQRCVRVTFGCRVKRFGDIDTTGHAWRQGATLLTKRGLSVLWFPVLKMSEFSKERATKGSSLLKTVCCTALSWKVEILLPRARKGLIRFFGCRKILVNGGGNGVRITLSNVSMPMIRAKRTYAPRMSCLQWLPTRAF